LVFTRGETVPGYRRWSRDGRLAEVDAEASIVVNRPNGTVERRLGPLPEAEAGIVIHSWSPDARWIVYSAYPTASDSIAQDGVPLYAVRVADGFAFRMGVTLDYDGWVQWSPDGVTVLMVDGGGRFLTERKVLRTCDLDVPRCVEVDTPSEASSFDPAWSPDGSRIAFVQVGAGGVAGAEFHGELVTADLSGANRHTFREDPPGVLHPMWTADGAAILVLRIVASDGVSVTVERLSSEGGPARELASFIVPGSMLQGYTAHMTPPMAWSASSR
jgi:Tol biopolymer transport system component